MAEHRRVRVSVSSERQTPTDAAELVAQQRRAMEELDAVMDTLPDNSPVDGFTAADHDSILYGPSE